MIDVKALKQQVDLLDLVGRDTQLRKVASTRGGEYAGPCPFCGGRDRLRVQPERRLWWCR
jgi:DNA primase